MYDPNCDLVTLDDLEEARTLLSSNHHCRMTPLLRDVHKIFDFPEDRRPGEMHFKMENMQVTGSYKVRGVINQLSHLPEGSEDRTLISYSAGNYGKAFAFLCSQLQRKALILMPVTAPSNRSKVIESFGVPTERWPSIELPSKINEYVRTRNMLFCHSFDDIRLIAGHGSAGLEVIEECPDADVVLVPCGGGALLAGVASAIKLKSKECRVYGIEPEGACTMYKSMAEGRVVSMDVKTIASGLAPPMAGSNALRHCEARVDGILLVTDDEICGAVTELYRHGLVVEPSGAAGYAALAFGKVPEVKGKKIVIVITGGNVTPEELQQIM